MFNKISYKPLPTVFFNFGLFVRRAGSRSILGKMKERTKDKGRQGYFYIYIYIYILQNCCNSSLTCTIKHRKI